MLIAVFIFFFTQKLLLKAFFSTTQVVLYHSNAQEFDKGFEFNPSPAKAGLPNLFTGTGHIYERKVIAGYMHFYQD